MVYINGLRVCYLMTVHALVSSHLWILLHWVWNVFLYVPEQRQAHSSRSNASGALPVQHFRRCSWKEAVLSSSSVVRLRVPQP